MLRALQAKRVHSTIGGSAGLRQQIRDLSIELAERAVRLDILRTQLDMPRSQQWS